MLMANIEKGNKKYKAMDSSQLAQLKELDELTESWRADVDYSAEQEDWDEAF